MKKLILGLAAILFAFSVKADEGMWITKELDEISVARMQELGFTYPIDSLYSEKKLITKRCYRHIWQRMHGCCGI